MRWHRLGERQAVVAATAGILFFAVPIAVGIALGLASGWFTVIGVHPRHMLWGWLSDTSTRDSRGHTVWDIGAVPIFYLFGVVNAYLAYQACEVLYGSFRAFNRALSAA